MDIRINNLEKIYRGNVHALNGLNLEIPNGMFGLLGPNGAGKTTLMRILAGILHGTSGELYVGEHNGMTAAGRTEIKRILGYLPQDLGVYPDLSAREFLDYIGILKGLNDKKARHKRVEELLELVALTHVANRKLKTYSGGMKRRAGIAQALLNDPKFLIVDEPTAGLDPEERIRFRNLLSSLGGNRVVLLSTHIVEDIAQTSQNIAMMRNGQVIFKGTLTDLINETQNKVWNVTSAGPLPQDNPNFVIVSTMNMGASMQYRIVGTPPANLSATPLAPNLEDGYVWLMHAPDRQPTSTLKR
ncbi:ABC transporter ATP-binding protein [Dictyobacter arantiisoli]|uniref:Multidrug ABC transporter ATP-binding protein n=1 Tax=Dictyobacter arantiisoli TaxID=2014874 RepID=A0A5A5T706_9CHLR|nr:ABC transporter ATP-binding protein [Dictyobacter arantiisoli]GCF07261.1 multidrug ABC transporter ATP-binding protein [Dictyobacter arantiisoli]